MTITTSNAADQTAALPAIEPTMEPTGTAGGLAPRLHPYDGLFLRAVHLDAIQDFGLSRQLRLARAGGAGVVEGLGLTLVSGKAEIHVGPGYGIEASGRILDMAGSMVVPLPGSSDPNLGSPTVDTQTVWEVVLVATSWYEGTDEVFNDLCGDACAPETGRLGKPYIREGVRIELRPVALTMAPRPDQSDDRFRRNRIVSAWFERERAGVESWIPAKLAMPVWATPPEIPAGRGVPLGLVWRYQETWYLDQWAARRQRTDPGHRSAMEGRLGMRPSSVFTAQVDQFQDHLSHVWSAGSPSLSALGFVELPPAGHLLWPQLDPDDRLATDDLLDALAEFFGLPLYRIHACLCRADHIAGKLEEAQHLDRLDLAESTTEIELLIPGIENDGIVGQGWLAYRRYDVCMTLTVNSVD